MNHLPSQGISAGRHDRWPGLHARECEDPRSAPGASVAHLCDREAGARGRFRFAGQVLKLICNSPLSIPSGPAQGSPSPSEQAPPHATSKRLVDRSERRSFRHGNSWIERHSAGVAWHGTSTGTRDRAAAARRRAVSHRGRCALDRGVPRARRRDGGPGRTDLGHDADRVEVVDLLDVVDLDRLGRILAPLVVVEHGVVFEQRDHQLGRVGLGFDRVLGGGDERWKLRRDST